MKRLLTPWFLLAVLTVGGVGATYLACPGCVNRNRANTACQWTGDSSFAIDARNPTQWRHLITDAQLAEELAVRYADAQHPHRYGFEAFAAHSENVRAQIICLAHLVPAIQTAHGVTANEVAVARGARSPAFDSLVVLLFLPLYGSAVTTVCRRFRNVLLADARYVRIVAQTLTAVPVSCLGLVSLYLWWTLMEGMRVGNPEGHMGTRAAAENYWTPQYVAAVLVGGMVLFQLVAIFHRPARKGEPRIPA